MCDLRISGRRPSVEDRPLADFLDDKSSAAGKLILRANTPADATKSASRR
jgi:hypothetical protein